MVVDFDPGWGPSLESHGNLFGPILQPFLVHLYLKAKCKSLKLLA